MLRYGIDVSCWPLATDRIFMADGRFGCEADMAGPAASSTRSLVTHKRRGAVALSNRLSTRFIGSFADKPTESGDSTIVWGRSPASPKRPPCKRRGHYG